MKRIGSMVEHSFTNPKVPGSITGPVSYMGHGISNASYSWSGPQLPKGCGCKELLSLIQIKIQDTYSKKEGGNPGNSGISF